MPIVFTILLYLLAFVIGAVFGSFANVCIYRIPAGVSIAFPPSHCPVCGSSISWYDNIPILSFLVLRGSCRQCRVPISFQYPIVELLCGLVSVACFFVYGISPAYPIYLLALLSMVVISAIDIRYYIIPNSIVLPGAVIAFACSFFLPKFVPWAPGPIYSLLGAFGGAGVLLGFALLYRGVTGREGMGFGDVKLLLMIGAFAGPVGVIETVMIASIIGTLFGLVVMVVFKKGRLWRIPFGPFLALGLFNFVFFGHKLFILYQENARLLMLGGN